MKRACETRLRCRICRQPFERKPGAHGRMPTVCYAPECRAKAQRDDQRARYQARPKRPDRVIGFRMPATAPVPAASAEPAALAVALTSDQVRALRVGVRQPFAQGAVLPSCPECRRLRTGRPASAVAGMLLCLRDELTCRDLSAGGTPDTDGRPPIVEDGRGDAPIYWLRQDVAHLGSARGCRYYLRRDG